MPLLAAWLDVLDPITELHVMGGLHNSLRRLVVDGEPVALGVHAVGDVVCTTNPTLARGLGLAARTVAALADALADRPDDSRGQAVALDEAVTDRVAPWYVDQAVNDAVMLARMRHTIWGTPAPTAPSSDRLDLGRLRAAAQVDAVAFRALWRLTAMIGRPSDVYGDPVLTARVRDVLSRRPPVRPPQPSHDELEAILAGSAVAGLPA